MQYNHKINEAIVKALNNTKEGKRSFTDLLKIVKESHHAITRRILSLHLKALEKQKIIERDPFKPGVERFSWLHNNIKWDLELELPIPRVRTKREENVRLKGKNKGSLLQETKKQKNKKVYGLMISLSLGFSVSEPINDKIHRMSNQLHGISISDFFHKYRDSANGWRFNYINFKDRSEVEWYFKKLMAYEPPIIRPVNEIEWIKMEHLQEKNLPWPIEGETRYGIVDKKLHECLQSCITLLGATEILMGYIWKYKRKPTRQEVEWHKFIYGKNHTNDFFLKTNQRRSQLKKATKIAADETINRIKVFPHKFYREIEEKYDNISENYKVIIDQLIRIAYPGFMNKLMDSS
jgi:hypothetical protein